MIKFNENKIFKSQQTLVHILKQNKYLFKSITIYDNTQFYLYIRHEKTSQFYDIIYKLFKWTGLIQEEEIKYVYCPLNITFCDELNMQHVEKIVFNRQDVQNIISDIPENYIGENIL